MKRNKHSTSDKPSKPRSPTIAQHESNSPASSTRSNPPSRPSIVTARRNASTGSQHAKELTTTPSPLGVYEPRSVGGNTFMSLDDDEVRASTSPRTGPFRRVGSPSQIASIPATEAYRSGNRIRHSISEDSDTTVRLGVSPALETAFASPSLETHSTDSTESNETVRGQKENRNAGDQPLRTPSYPFPRISSRSSSSRQAPLHEPFTALSPISPSTIAKGQTRTREKFESRNGPAMRSRLNSTPMSTTDEEVTEDFRTPDLYDVVLRLNSELSLETWWDRLISITRHEYRAHRLSLAVPVDATDIENVPWGQKAAFNAQGLRLAWSSADPSSSDSWSTSSPNHGNDVFDDEPIAVSRLASVRPVLDTRHSYGGYEAPRGSMGSEAMQPEALPRPVLSRWMTSDVAVSAAQYVPNTTQKSTLLPVTPIVQPIRGDLDAKFGQSSSDPPSVCHKTLYALDRENDPLIDSAGINRVLERNSNVLLTREIKNDQRSVRKLSKGNLFSSSQKEGLYGSRTSMSVDYEDYEQQPATPWTQSPAPSPAMRQDPDENPFFSPDVVNEQTFEPMASETPDYSRGFEAIGVDNASTLIHVPLVHPALSRVLPSLEDDASTPLPNVRNAPVPVRKAPIAILSIMSDTVPYPRNWAESIEMLSPHLATSFHTCYQNSMISDRLDQALERQSQFNQPVSFSTKDNEPFALGLGLDSLLQYENDGTNSSTIASLASPSEGHSVYSGHSEAASPVVTPGQLTSSEATQSYFDPKKRQSLDRSRSSGIVPQSQLAAAAAHRHISNDHRSALRNLEGLPTTQEGRHIKSHRESPRGRDQDAPKRNDRPSSGHNQPSDTPARHGYTSTLHSRGADFKASFPSLPVAASKGLVRSRTAHSTASPISSTESHPVGISDSLVRMVIDTIPVQIFIADPVTSRIRWVNSKFLAYGGLSVREAVSYTPWETVHPDESAAAEAAWMKAISTGQQLQLKSRIRRFDGNYRYQYIRAAPLRTADQRIVHWVGAITDFHDQHVAEMNASKQQETAQSEAKYRALANSSPQVVFSVTRKLGVTFCNTQWPAFSGQTEEQALGLGFLEHVHPEDLAKCHLPSFDEDNNKASNVPISMLSASKRSVSSGAASELSSSSSGGSRDTILASDNSPLRRTSHMPQRKLSELATTGILSASRDAAGKQSYSTEVRLRDSSGEYRWHLVRLLLAEPIIQGDTNEQEMWYGTCTDINDHKELEQTLKETMDAKSRFLSNMSHEIRTPLNGIMGMTNFLIDSKLTNEQADHINVIRASTEGLRDLINDILDLSKVEAGMIKLSMDWLHFRSVVEAVTDLTSAIGLDKGIEVNYLVEQDVPSMLKGDQHRFRQILLNVIGNAVKFTQQGEVYVHCKQVPTLPEEQNENSVLIQVDVIDTGTGFSEKEAEMLFKRFSQIDQSSTRQHGGSGLGLVISMQLVELHGGHMSATSTVGEGSCFTFTMRFGTASTKDQPPKASTPEGREAQSTVYREAMKRQSPASPKSSEDETRQIFASEELVDSPAAYPKLDDPSPSSAGSEHSARTSMTSRKSSKSSQSSTGSFDTAARSMNLEIVPEERFQSPLASALVTPSMMPVAPRLYSILVVSPLRWTREAIVGHLSSIMDRKVPHSVTSRGTLEDANKLLRGDDFVNFTHIILILKDVDDIMTLMTHTYEAQSSATTVVIACDTEQKKQVLEQKRYTEHVKSRRLLFIQKPLKPSRLAVIFDPGKERELSTDVNQSSHQQVAAQQKQVLDNMADRLGDRGLKVLLVEDNKINQMVMVRLLKRVSVSVDTVLDGVQATEKVFSAPVGFYSIILMDLMMPNKDGYESCKEIRAWEKKNGYVPMPIIALSANVLDDVWRKCKQAGFNSYLTKPLQFQELGDVMTTILDPKDPNKPLAFMKSKGGPMSKSSGR